MARKRHPGLPRPIGDPSGTQGSRCVGALEFPFSGEPVRLLTEGDTGVVVFKSQITDRESKIVHLKKRLCLTAKDAEGNGPAVRCTFFTFHFCRLPSALCRLPFPVDCSQTRLFGAVCITPSTHLQNLSPSSTYSGNQLERRS